MSPSDHPLDRLAAQAVVGWYQRLIARESWARAALDGYAGRVARIEIGFARIELRILPGGDLAAGGNGRAPDVSVAANPAAVAQVWADPSSARRDLRIEGDVDFAQTLIDVLQKLRPDPAEDLSRFVGDIAAERIVNTLQTVLEQARDVAWRAARQGADYWVAENPMLLGTQEFVQHRIELAALLERIDRITRRVGALDRGHDSAPRPGAGQG